MKIGKRPSRSRAGSVLVLSLLLLLVVGGLATTLSVLNLHLQREHQRAREDLRALCVAEAGLNEAYAMLLGDDLAGVQALAYPRPASAGSYEVHVLDGRDDPEIDVDRIRLRSVGSAGGELAGVQLMIHHVPTGDYEFAAFGAEGVLLNSNVVIDSFDSDEGPYDGDSANDYGNVGSFAEIQMDSNVEVHGDALVGTDGSFDDDAPGIEVTGDQEATDLASVEMPVITVPSYPTLGTVIAAGSTSLAPGNYHYTSLTVDSGTLNIAGPATLVLDDFVLKSGTKIVIDGSLGPVQIYATGNFDLRSNSQVLSTTQRARDIQFLITSDNIDGGAIVNLDSNTDFYGTIYAPNAKIDLSSNFTVFGAVKAEYVELSSNTTIHFDEDLLYDPAMADVFERVSWRRLGPAEVVAVQEALAAAP